MNLSEFNQPIKYDSSDRYVQLERCMKTVAEKCGEKFDEDLLEDAFLKNELFDYFKTMRLFEVKI